MLVKLTARLLFGFSCQRHAVKPDRSDIGLLKGNASILGFLLLPNRSIVSTISSLFQFLIQKKRSDSKFIGQTEIAPLLILFVVDKNMYEK